MRKSLGLNGIEFSENIGISQGHLSGIENGKAKIGKTLLLAISHIYKADVVWLKTGEGSPHIIKEDDMPADGPPTANNRVELQHMNLVKEFVDKQRALNIDRELIELEKLDPETFKRVESYIKGTVDAVREVVKRKPHQ